MIFPKQFGISDNETIYYIISIITDPANLFSFENGIYVKGKVWAANWDEEKAQSDPGYQETAKANYKMKGKDWRWIRYDTDDSASMIDSYGLTG